MDNPSNYYDVKYSYIPDGLPNADVLLEVANIYLDCKPAGQDKLSLNAAYRDVLFWIANFLDALPNDIFREEHFILALARYMDQEKIDNFDWIRRIALAAPDAIQRAVRYSRLIMRNGSKRWAEIECLADGDNLFSELLAIHHIFKDAHQLRLDDITKYPAQIKDLMPLEILTYASLYAFQYLLSEKEKTNEVEQNWRAINDILIWALANSSTQNLRLNDQISAYLSLKVLHTQSAIGTKYIIERTNEIFVQ